MNITWNAFHEWLRGNESVRSAAARCDATDGQLRELGRYLYLRVANAGARWPLHRKSGLDKLWHALILETKTYAVVCEKLGAFVQHESGVITKDPMWYPNFLAAYKETFDETPDWNVWPSPSKSGQSDENDHDCG
jgi:hypothetical protein